MTVTNVNYLGTVETRETFTLNLAGATALPQGKIAYYFIDRRGRRAIWYSSKLAGFTENHNIRIKATVKEHTTQDGEPITVFTRVKQI